MLILAVANQVGDCCDHDMNKDLLNVASLREGGGGRKE